MEKYEKGAFIAEGTFGVVFQALLKETNDAVAIKKIRMGKEKEGVNVTALREIKLLKELRSPHIVRLYDVFARKRNVYLVFEFMEGDLEAIIKDRSIIFSAADIKSYLKMILQAIDYCHKHWVLHRDIKPNNFLISKTGELKLTDFGLSRIFGSPNRKYTNQVFARWYRPPELLYGSTCYGPGVDMWACGCTFAELMLRRPWFQGDSDIDQLSKIFQVLGTPTEEQWKGIKDLPNYVEFQRTAPQNLRQVFKHVASEDAIDLLQRMVALDPSRRISAAAALEHRYFAVDPQPTPEHMLPKINKVIKPQAASTKKSPVVNLVASPHYGLVDGEQNNNSTRKTSNSPVNSTQHSDRQDDGAAVKGTAKRRKTITEPTSAHSVDSPSRRLHPQLPVSSSPCTVPPDQYPHGMTLFVERDAAFKPQVDSTDMTYLRKRKLDMDALM